MNFGLKNILAGMSDMVLVTFMVGILIVLFTPIPAGLLDFLLLLNFSTAMLILLVTFYTEKPLSFSTFPSLLLMTTLFRLALNISSTRLILDQASAGKVINAVGTYVIGGNYIIGLVVFLILIIVQYVVVTNGAQRVAEVAARFTLDSLPGKQMSVDADLNMGLIDQDQAKKRRADLERESSFYGAMDGASKFVKGDAIAGIIIVIINIVGGLAIGIVQNGMSWSDALHRYTLLTVGDGIVTQIPSLVIATATGIIITRAATDARLGDEITRQFSAHPKTLIIVALALFALMFLPGLPVWQILGLILLLAAGAWFSYRKNVKKTIDELSSQLETAITDLSNTQSGDDLYALMKVEPFQLSVGKKLSAHISSALSDSEQRIAALRKQTAKDFGVLLPTLSIKTDIKLSPTQYAVFLQGVQIAAGEIEPDKMLAISPTGQHSTLEGIETREPTYGLPALWIIPENRAQAKASGYTIVEPETVLITHLQELCKQYAAEFLSRAGVEQLIENRRDSLGGLVDELIPTIMSYSDVQRVLQALLREQIPIINLQAILEVLADSGRQIKVPEELAEKVRERLGASICEQVKNTKNEIHVLTLSPELERQLMSSAKSKENIMSMFSGVDFERLVSKIASESEKMLKANKIPVLLCAAPIRRPIRHVISRAVPQLRVISINEITNHVRIISFGVVSSEKLLLEAV